MRILHFYKPYGVLTQFTDPQGRPTLSDYIPVPGVYAAGRLDFDSEGLLLLTDDGPLTARLLDPNNGHPRTYLVQVEKVPDEDSLQRLRIGVPIANYVTRPAQVELLTTAPELPERAPPIRVRKLIPTAWLRLTLIEGRNRQVRHMTAAVGFPTLRLVRESIGPITLNGLALGEWRDLSPDEAIALHKSVSRRR